MLDKVLLSLMVTDVLFLATGGLMVGVAVKANNDMISGPTLDTVASNLLISRCPLTGKFEGTERGRSPRRRPDLTNIS